jgi:hypothetical protein
MKNFYRAIICFLFVCVASGIFAQSPEAEGDRSGKILDNIRDLDLLNKILPIIWTKAELKVVLPEIERVRTKVRETHHEEYKALIALDPKVTEAIDKAMKDGVMPGRQLLNELEANLEKMEVARTAIGKANENAIYDAMNPVLNAGQKKAMANALDPGTINPALKAEKMTDEDKIRFYIRNILLDPLAYDLLVKLSLSSTTPEK